MGPVAGAVVAMLAGCTMLAGCSSLVGSVSDSGASPAPNSISEVSASAELYRTRTDPARGGIQLSVSNASATPLTIVHVLLDSAALSRPIERERTTVVPAGATRDLALLLPDPRCTNGPILPDAVLTVLLGSGETAVVRLPTTDRLGQWRDWHDAACFAAAAAEQVDLDVRRAPLLDDLSEGRIGAELVATSRSGAVTLVSIDDTVLFSLLDGPAGAARLSTLPIERSLPPGETVVIPLYLTAARCDPHAVAEDKQGTLFAVRLDLDGDTGTTTVITDDGARAALYDAIAETCRF